MTGWKKNGIQNLDNDAEPPRIISVSVFWKFWTHFTLLLVNWVQNFQRTDGVYILGGCASLLT